MRASRHVVRFIAAAALLLPAIVRAQAARPGARLDTSTVAFDTGGLHVILRRNPANTVVAVNLYLLGGTQMVTQADAGIEPFLLWVSERGTAHYSRDALRRKIAALGSGIVVEPRDDWTMFGFRGVRATFDSTWAIWADRLIAGSVESEDVEFVREQRLAIVRQAEDSPDGLVHLLADSVRFVGQPYSILNEGTERSLSAITPAQLAAWRTTKFITSRMLLVVVGNVDRESVARMVVSTFGKLPRGDYKWTPPTATPGANGPALLVNRRLPTNYLLGSYIGPPPTSSDAIALRIATSVLSGSLFSEIRTRRNLTYNVNAPFLERAITTGGLYVSTVYPDSVLTIMRREIDYMKRNKIQDEHLSSVEQMFITEFFLGNETNAEQANQLARAQVYRGDYRLAGRFVEEVRGVSPTAVQYVTMLYMKGFRWAYVGDTARVNRAKLSEF